MCCHCNAKVADLKASTKYQREKGSRSIWKTFWYFPCWVVAIYNITYEINILISFAGSVAVITHSSKGIPMLYLSVFFKVALQVPGHDRTRAGETILNDAIIDRHQNTVNQWWRHQMERLSALLAVCAGNSPVTGEFPARRPVTRSFEVFFDLRLNNKLLNKQKSWV